MKTVKILLADDHAVVRAGIRNALNDVPNLEFMAEVGDGPSLVQALEKETPDCLLIDITMPDFDPLATVRQIRQKHPSMKILVVSAYDDDVYVQGLLGAGVDGYHLKDQPLSDLKLALERVLNGQKWVSSRLLTKLVTIQGQNPHNPITPLTSRQRDILQLLHEGLDNQSIGRRMSLSVKTVENHLTRLYRQLNVQSRLEAVTYVGQHPELLGLSGQTAAQKRPVTPVLVGQISIMVVDDNSRYRHQLQLMIGKVCPQATIFEASNITRAVELAQQIMPHLVLVDVVLGDENGIHCTRRIKSISPLSRIVLISAYPDREFHRSGLEAGAVAFLDKKDLDTSALQQVINDLAI